MAWLAAIAERDAVTCSALACLSVCDIRPYSGVIPVTCAVTFIRYKICSELASLTSAVGTQTCLHNYCSIMILMTHSLSIIHAIQIP